MELKVDGVPVVAQQLTNPNSIHENVGSILGLPQWVGYPPLRVNCDVGCRRGLDPELLWLWCRPEATAPIGPLSLGTAICLRCGPKKKKDNKKKKRKLNQYIPNYIVLLSY